ncbi:MAG: hypothetical protein EXS35_01100 [Pedosphaera sp.]|nr:hypothetical protein [Pedosphaera sp.]
MKILLTCSFVAVLLLAGCAQPGATSDVKWPPMVRAGGGPPPAPTAPPPIKASKPKPAPRETAPPPPAPKPQPTPPPIVTADNSLTGKVARVNDAGRFVVLQFPIGRMPAAEQNLFLYRNGVKVAELKVTGPQKDDHTVADLTTGDAQLGDEVRDK